MKRYFSELTGQSLPKSQPITGRNAGPNSVRYTVDTKYGSFNLRNFSKSAEQSGANWTIDIPENFLNTPRNLEIKFK